MPSLLISAERGELECAAAESFTGIKHQQVSRWARYLKDRQAYRAKLFDMWMACATQEEIAAAEDVAGGTIGEMAKGFLDLGKLAKNEKAAAEHAVYSEVPIYKQGEKTLPTALRTHRGRDAPAGRQNC